MGWLYQQAWSDSMVKKEKAASSTENFILHVATEGTADIQVWIDGKSAVHAKFDKKGSSDGINMAMSVPSYQIFKFRLTPGTHQLKAREITHKEKFEINFDVTQERQWGLVYYIKSKKKSKPFSFRLSKEEITYM